VAHCQRRVNFPIRCVDLLYGISVRVIHFVIVDLLEIYFGGAVAHIVLVRRIARPVAAWSINLDDEQSLSWEIRLQDVIDLSGGIGAAANLDFNIARSTEASLILLVGFTKTKGEIAISLGLHRERCFDRKVERVWQPAEHVCTTTQIHP